MKIFLSHKSRDKALVREFGEMLPSFLESWLDEESLIWGEPLSSRLESAIQLEVDFLIVFLGKDTLESQWVRRELEWAVERENEGLRAFVLPILLGDVSLEDLPSALSDRQYLRLHDYAHTSIQALASQATVKLFQLIVEDYLKCQSRIPGHGSLDTLRDELSAGQAKLLGYLVESCSEVEETNQRQIEEALRYPHASGELYYRLETLILQGFISKRRISAEGQFAYRLNSGFRDLLQREDHV